MICSIRWEASDGSAERGAQTSTKPAPQQEAARADSTVRLIPIPHNRKRTFRPKPRRCQSTVSRQKRYCRRCRPKNRFLKSAGPTPFSRRLNARRRKRPKPTQPRAADVIYQKKAPATDRTESAARTQAEPSAPAGSVNEPTRVDIPLASLRTRSEKTRVIDRGEAKPKSAALDVYTGQVPLPGFAINADSKQSDDWENELLAARSKRVQNFVLSGQEEENEPEEEPTVDEDIIEIDDYEGISDAPAIQMDLLGRRRSYGVRLTVTVLLEALLLLLGAHTVFFSHILGSVLTMPVKLIANAVITAVVILVNASTVFGGLGSLFRLKVDLDTAAAVSMLAAFVHNVIVLCVTDTFEASGLYVYNAAAVFALVCNLYGKRSMITRIARNFELVGNETPKKAVMLEGPSQAAEEMGHGLAMGEALVCCEKETITVRRFLDHSYVQDPADESAQKLAPWILAAGLAAAVLAFFFPSDSSMALIQAITAFSAVSCVCTPVTSLLAGNLPLGRTCRRLSSRGILLTGYDAVYDFSDANVMAMDARDLFPKGTVSLHQLKTFGNQSIDRALLDAAGLAITANGPLASVFEEIIEGQRDILPEVDTLVYEEKMGISGWVSGNRVLIGNRLLMKNHGIELPDNDLERRLCKHGQHAVYLATRGALSAVFVVSYQADEAVVEALQKAVDSGLGLAVYSCDPIVTPELIDELFGVSPYAVSVMSTAGRHAFQKSTRPADACDASLAHFGGVEGMADGVCACQTLYRSIRFAKGIQIALWVLGLVLSLLLVAMKGIGLLSVAVVLGFQLISVFLVLCLPALIRG